MISPGIYHDMPEGEYHSAPGVSATILKAMRRSPAHMRVKLADREDEDTPFGTIFHRRMLEPERYKAEIVIIPPDAPKRPTEAQRNAAKPSPKTLEQIAWWADFDAKTEGKEIISATDASNIEKMAMAVLGHRIAGEIFRSEYRTEVSLFIDDPVTGLPIRCRVDLLSGVVMVDIKTTYDASDWQFAKIIDQMGYHLQAAHYMRIATLLGLAPERFIFIAVEAKPPYGVNTFEIGAASLAKGDEECARLLALYKECVEKDAWPAYEQSLRAINIPRYALTREQDAEVIYSPED
ncbi:MAG: PD-(D/E)XK nuclease-like domain-containing protein [Verrucomicrobium sp.]|nr:PD-(D/E)XK nuclease-like domain-containing protein [Verrucomicrobium sp.]